MRKKFLWVAMSIVMLAGVSFCLYPFLSSLNPSGGAGADLPFVDVSFMLPGELITYDRPDENSRHWGKRYQTYREYAGNFRVYLVFLRNGQVNMPDMQWWRMV